jgi:LPS sulfotransferase NodH
MADLVQQTGLVGRLEEYFRPDHLRRWSSAWRLPPEAPYGRYIYAALARTSTPNGVFGVKLHWYQLEWFVSKLRTLPRSRPGVSDADLIRQWLPGPRYVHLHREDTVRQAISYYRATYSDRWFERYDDASSGFARLHRPLPAPEVPDWGQVRYLEDSIIKHERRWNDFFAATGVEPLEIRYETLVESHQETVTQVLDFLGVPIPARELPVIRLKKLADEQTERLVEAYLRVRDTVEPRPLEVERARENITPRPIGPPSETPAR